jgi:hypothetical protein
MPWVSFTDVFAVPPEDEPEAEQQAWTAPAWFGPPESELAVPVALGVVVGRSDRAVVAASHAFAYSTGIAFELLAVARVPEREVHRIFHEQHGIAGDDLSPAFLRVGMELADGTRVSNLGGRRGRHHDPERPPEGSVLSQHGGGGGTGGSGSVTMRPGFWLWPLPPDGPLRLSCEWPLVDVPLSTVEIDATALTDAAARATPLWS